MYEKKYSVGRREIKETVYEKSNLYATGGNRQIEKGQEGRYRKQNSKQRQSIRKKTVKELMLNNFEEGEAKFITLTFENEEMGKNLKTCEKEFKKFVERLKYRFNKFAYVATIELQEERQTFHYHVVCDLPEVEQKELVKIWGLGSVWIKQIYNLSGLSDYITKGFTEENAENLQGKKGYRSSRGLKKNKIVRSWKEWEQLSLWDIEKKLEGVKPDYSYVTEQEDAGKFYHSIYNGVNGLYEEMEVDEKKVK